MLYNFKVSKFTTNKTKHILFYYVFKFQLGYEFKLKQLNQTKLAELSKEVI